MPTAAAMIGGVVTGQIGSTVVSQAGSGLFGAVGQFGNYIMPTGIVPFDTLVHLFRTGWVDNQDFHNARRILGFQGEPLSREDYIVTVWSEGNKAVLKPINPASMWHINDWSVRWAGKVPSIDETLFLFNRQLIDINVCMSYLNMNTGGEPGQSYAWLESRYEIPGPSDLIHFAVRDAYTPDVVSTFGYNKELPIAIIPWMDKQGLGGPIGFNIPPGSTTTQGPDFNRPAKWFDLYWWSHWQLPSPTQGYEFLHRMYLTSDYGPAPGINANNQFTVENMRLLLKANDYPEFWRDRFIHVSYHPLTRVDVRRMYDMYVLGEAEVYHAYRAIGYDDTNAKALLEWTKKLRADKVAKKNLNPMIKEIRDLFVLGAITILQTDQQLQALGLVEDERLPLRKLWELQRKKGNVKESIKAIKEAFMRGMFDMLGTTGALTNLGIDPLMVKQYTDHWQRVRQAKRKYVSAQTNIDYYVNGMIPPNTLVYLLTNLNYYPDEIQRMTQYAAARRNQMIADNIAKAAAAAAKANKAALDMLLKPYTDKTIKDFYKKGLYTQLEIYKILRLRGFIKRAALDWLVTYLDAELTDEQIATADDVEIDESWSEETTAITDETEGN